jgi:hypothetical protein
MSLVDPLILTTDPDFGAHRRHGCSLDILTQIVGLAGDLGVPFAAVPPVLEQIACEGLPMLEIGCDQPDTEIPASVEALEAMGWGRTARRRARRDERHAIGRASRPSGW